MGIERRRSALYGGTANWLTANWRVVESFPDPVDEPLLRVEFPDAMREEFYALRSYEIIEGVERVNREPTGVPITRWRISPIVREWVDRVAEPPDSPVNGGDSPLPCNCAVFKVRNHGDVIECLECGDHHDRSDCDV